MFGFTSVFLVFLIVFVLYIIKSVKNRPKNFPPGPPRLPIWGSYWFLLKENFSFLHLSTDLVAKRYKSNLLGFYVGNIPTVITMNYQLTKEMLTRDEFMGRPDSIIPRTRGKGELRGIFFADGEFWKGHRWFSLRRLRDYGFGRRSDVVENFIADEIKYVMNFLTSEPQEKDKDICRGKGHVLIPDFLYGSLVNSVMLVLSSTQFEHHKCREYARAAFRFLKSNDASGGALAQTPWLRYFASDYFGYTSTVEDNAILDKFMKDVIDEHIRTFSDDHHRDFIDDYISENLKNGTEIDYDQLSLVALDYMFPSPMGIGHTLAFFFALLINYPHVQVKIQEEIDRVVTRSRLPTLDDRKDLPYLDATLREVLRIYPILPLGLPRRSVQDTTLGGYFIPKDTLMLSNIWTAYRDESVFPNPEKFEPERFLEKDGSLMRKDLTMSFGAGKRLCAGETFSRNTMFLIMSALLQNFTIKSTDGKPVNLKDFSGGLLLSLKETWILTVPR